GAGIARALHAAGYRIALHCHHSVDAAELLAVELNRNRPGSVQIFRADLLNQKELEELPERVVACWGRLDALINNASRFYPTPVGEATRSQWEDLLGSNLAAPYFLIQSALPHLRRHHGAIVNLADIHAERGLPLYTIYAASKAGLIALTRSLARELAPEIRVNAVAPGAILWPEEIADEESQRRILAGIPFGRLGGVEDIADAVRFLVEAPYITGQVLAVDGGRSLAG
ncbi:MAG: pteridine reductase, partial [Methylococcaceae bacterium]|nr:pteridine reductase [Methylococcaceae bacterium]